MLLLISFILCECSILGIFNFILKIPSYSDSDLNLLCAYMGTTERMIIKDLAQEILPHFHVVQLHLTLCDRMDCGTPGLPQFSSVSQSCSTLQPHGLLHARLPCPPPAPETCPNSCPSSRWCHPTISSSVVPFSSCLQSFPASRSFPIIQFFTSGGQTIGVSASASVLPMNIQDWFLLGWTGWISL